MKIDNENTYDDQSHVLQKPVCPAVGGDTLSCLTSCRNNCILGCQFCACTFMSAFIFWACYVHLRSILCQVIGKHPTKAHRKQTLMCVIKLLIQNRKHQGVGDSNGKGVLPKLNACPNLRHLYEIYINSINYSCVCVCVCVYIREIRYSSLHFVFKL